MSLKTATGLNLAGQGPDGGAGLRKEENNNTGTAVVTGQTQTMRHDFKKML